MLTSYYSTLVLSGGSIKSIGALGALQYCIDKNLLGHIRTYIGTSAGAIILYLMAIGYTPSEIIVYICTHDIFEDVNYLDIVSMASGCGAISFLNFLHHLEKMTIDKIGYLPTFQDIELKFHKKLIVTTYNYTKQQAEYLSVDTTPSLPCLIALRMTSCLPLVFDMFKYMDNYYIDGGIVDNFPIDYDDDGSHRLGILIDMYDEGERERPLGDHRGVLEYIYNLLLIPLKQQLYEKLERISSQHDIIRVKSDIGFLNYGISCRDKLDLFSMGYQDAVRTFETKV